MKQSDVDKFTTAMRKLVTEVELEHPTLDAIDLAGVFSFGSYLIRNSLIVGRDGNEAAALAVRELQESGWLPPFDK